MSPSTIILLRRGWQKRTRRKDSYSHRHTQTPAQTHTVGCVVTNARQTFSQTRSMQTVSLLYLSLSHGTIPSYPWNSAFLQRLPERTHTHNVARLSALLHEMHTTYIHMDPDAEIKEKSTIHIQTSQYINCPCSLHKTISLLHRITLLHGPVV